MKKPIFRRILFSLFVVCCSLELGAMQAPAMPEVDDTAIQAPTSLDGVKNTVLGHVVNLSFDKVFDSTDASKLSTDTTKVLDAVNASKTDVSEDVYNAYIELFWSKVGLALVVQFVKAFTFDDVATCSKQAIENIVTTKFTQLKGRLDNQLVTSAAINNDKMNITVQGITYQLEICDTIGKIAAVLTTATTFVKAVKTALTQWGSALIDAKVIKFNSQTYTLKEYTQSIQELCKKLVQEDYIKLVRSVAQRFAGKGRDFARDQHTQQVNSHISTQLQNNLYQAMDDARDTDL